MKLGYHRITIDEDAIYLDGCRIDGTKLAPKVTVTRAGENDASNMLTMHIYADNIDMTDAVRNKDNQAVICAQTYTSTHCRHYNEQGELMPGCGWCNDCGCGGKRCVSVQ